MKLELIEPNTSYKKSYKAYITELGSEERYPYPMDFEYSDFPALIQKLCDHSKGINLPDWQVPNSTYWLIQNDELIGVAHLRHQLNDLLREVGGHIGLGIRPSYRKHGYGNILLGLTIDKAKDMGIKDIHIHCHKNNKASARMILSNGGILVSLTSDKNKTIQRCLVKGLK